MKAKPANPFGQGRHGRRADRGLPDLPRGQPQPRVLGRRASTQLNEVDLRELPQHPRQGLDRTRAINKFTTTFLPNQADICGTCHQPIRAATLKPSHHPIIEGKVKCTDCHNPHGALTPAMLKQPTINDQCYSCHADKRGPYVFKHPPVEENCLTCHNPHGSSHDEAAERDGAEPLPGLPRLVAAPRHDLRRSRRRQLPAGRHRHRPAASPACAERPDSPTRASTPASSRAPASTATTRSTARTRRPTAASS